jgi:hypothetical protein
MSVEKSEKEIEADWSVKDLPETERINLLGFFAMLLKVDKRVNPHIYANNNNAGYSDTNNS